MTAEEYEQNEIEGKTCVILKNLDHCTTVGSVPVFKMNSKTFINESRYSENEDEMKLTLDQQEIDEIEKIDVSSFLRGNVRPSSVKKVKKVSMKRDEKITTLTLEQFYEDYPSYTDNDQSSCEVMIHHQLFCEIHLFIFRW